MSIPRKPIDWKLYDSLPERRGKDAAFARSIPMDPGLFYSYKKSRWRDEPTVASAEDTAPHSADHSAEQVILPDTSAPTVQEYALDSAETLADHETRLQVLESFLKALQEQAQQPPVQHITVQSSAYALHSAESVQTWEDPEDAKPERWNLWLPRGLKRRIEAQAKSAGIAPSSLVQRLLIAAINGQEVDANA